MRNDLETRFVNYMLLHRYSKETIRNYLRAVDHLADYYKKPPDQLGAEEIQAYLVHLTKEKN